MGGKSYKALIIICCLLFVSCVKDKPIIQNSITPGSSGNVYIVCEGNFGNGDGTLYAYHPSDSTIFGDIFYTANHKPLGDVFQSMKRIGDKFFLCINNSDKIVVLNASNWALVSIINIRKPRYILPISATKAYVSSIYSNKLYVIDPQTQSVTDTIVMPSMNPEGLCLYNTSAIVCTWDTASNNIYQVDVTTDKIVQTFKVSGYAPQEALLDKEQMLWVLSGNPTSHRTCALTRIDPSTGAILSSFIFPPAANTVRPVFNGTKDTLYFIEANQDGGTANNGIYRMDIHSTVLPVQPFVAAKQYQYFWALGIEPLNGNIYIGDPKGFIQKGSVYIYKQDGTQIHSFTVGLGPGHFYFDY